MTLAPQYHPLAIARRGRRPLEVRSIDEGWSGYALAHRAKRCRALAEQAENLAAGADDQLRSLYQDLMRELLTLVDEIEASAA